MITYTTVQGDKWDGISYKMYEAASFVDVLIEANPRYRDIYIFSEGETLNIPETEKGKTAERLPPWKRSEE